VLLGGAARAQDDPNACEDGARTSIFAIVESVEERGQDGKTIYRISLGRAQGDCTVQYVNVGSDPRPACDAGKTLSATGAAQIDADGAAFVAGPESFSCN
jgi:hypothetical protein